MTLLINSLMSLVIWEAVESETKVPTRLGSDESPVSGLRMAYLLAVPSHDVGESNSVVSFSSYKETLPS